MNGYLIVMSDRTKIIVRADDCKIVDEDYLCLTKREHGEIVVAATFKPDVWHYFVNVNVDEDGEVITQREAL